MYGVDSVEYWHLQPRSCLSKVPTLLVADVLLEDSFGCWSLRVALAIHSALPIFISPWIGFISSGQIKQGTNQPEDNSIKN